MASSWLLPSDWNISQQASYEITLHILRGFEYSICLINNISQIITSSLYSVIQVLMSLWLQSYYTHAQPLPVTTYQFYSTYRDYFTAISHIWWFETWWSIRCSIRCKKSECWTKSLFSLIGYLFARGVTNCECLFLFHRYNIPTWTFNKSLPIMSYFVHRVAIPDKNKSLWVFWRGGQGSYFDNFTSKSLWECTIRSSQQVVEY